MKIKKEDYTVTLNDSVKTREEIFEAIIDWMEKNEFYSGEDMQCDNFVIDSPNLIADIIDNIIKPEIKYNETI